jgi:carbamoyltransferase
MIILGISAFYHDAAACLVIDGEIVAAAQEERFTRKKHDPAFPRQAMDYCLTAASCTPASIDLIVFYDKDKLFQKQCIADTLRQVWGSDIDWSARLLFAEHRLSQAASAFFPSPFEEAAVLSLDGGAASNATSLAIGQGNSLQVQQRHFPHSLGLLYSTMTDYLGFKVNAGEYKVMGLAPYGEPRYAGLIRQHLVEIREDSSFALNMAYFDHGNGAGMSSRKFNHLFGAPRRQPESVLTQRDMDLAASLQQVTEEVVIALARDIARSTGQKNLCLTGAVALNCVANGKLQRAGMFENIWIQPAAGDAGCAIGAALWAYHMVAQAPRRVRPGQDAMHGAYLGPDYAQEDIEQRLHHAGARFTSYTEAGMIRIAAQALADGKALGWHQGRMEFGPRSLGGRSILADPRVPGMQKLLNRKVKYRESFRPFAPSVLREDVSAWFDFDDDSPYMLMVAEVAQNRRLAMSAGQNQLSGIDQLNVARSSIPAVTHVDYSARLQTVQADTNPRYHALIRRFKELTGCPILVNTSFNVRGEPIVSSPEDAFRCFMGTGIDMLVVGNCVLHKQEQAASLRQSYEGIYELD